MWFEKFIRKMLEKFEVKKLDSEVSNDVVIFKIKR
jgi:hypothetical protein